MKLDTILDKVSETLKGVRLGGKKGDKALGELDRGVLGVALLLAALDGSVLPAEYAAFEELAKACRGGSAKAARALLDKVLPDVGYLIAMAQVGVYSEKERLAAFVEMATRALPHGFESGSAADLRRAFALFVAMGVSDGTFSDIERKAVEALAARYAGIRQAKAKERAAYACAVCPALRQATRGEIDVKRTELIEPPFFSKVERLVRDLAVASKREIAKTALVALIGSVEVAMVGGVSATQAAEDIVLAAKK